MNAVELQKGLFWCGALDPNLRVFDIIMQTEFGTTYNAYLLKGSEKTALIETAKLTFFDAFLETLTGVADVSSIDYIVMNHTEPDHAGSIERLVEMNPNVKIVATPTAIGFLRHIVNRDFYSVPVKDGDTLDLGGRTLSFLALPNLHWPDTMYSYLKEDQVLFTCDSFGAHYSCPGVLRSAVEDEAGYARAAKYYFDNIIGPFKRPYMSNALDKIRDLPLSMICPGHGPVLNTGIDQVLSWYKTWCAAPETREKKRVAMPYVSAYGYTRQLAQRIEEGILASGAIDVEAFDLVTAQPGAALSAVLTADGVLLGTPTILGEALKPIWDLTTSMYPPLVKGKLASAFGSYGWSGEGVPHILERLKQLRMNVLEGFRVRFKPSDNELLDAYEYGYNFGCALLGKDNDRKKAKSATPGKVRCLVCGAVFDANTEICPVCGVGKDKFLPFEEAAQGLRRDTGEVYLIAGGGPAAFYAAKSIREIDKTGIVILLSRETARPYNRPMLTKTVLADFSGEQLAIEPEAWYAGNKIAFVGGMEITKIDPQNQFVYCGEERFGYDKLILATGARCFVPPIPGANLPHVVTMRELSDAQKIRSLLPVQNAVVIGGGVLGLESAWELKKGGTNVTVLEVAPRLMPRQLDEKAAELLTRLAGEKGVRVRVGVKIEEIEEDAVRLDGGERVPAGLVVISAGVSPNKDAAQQAGVDCGRAIRVDDHMRTNLPGVFACGDCAEFEGVNRAQWAQAAAMGEVAGANAAGGDALYAPVSGGLTFSGFGTSLFAMGDAVGAEVRGRTLEVGDEARGVYEKFRFVSGRLAGAILLGDTSKIAEITKAVEDGARFEDVLKML